MRQLSLFSLVIGLLNYRVRSGNGLPATGHAPQLTEDEVTALRGGLSHAIRDETTFDALFDFYIGLPDEGEAEPMPEGLRRRASEPDMPMVAPEELIRLATTPVWVAELRDAVVALQPETRQDAGSCSGCQVPAATGLEVAERTASGRDAVATGACHLVGGRKSPWRSGLRLYGLLALAATVLIAVAALIPNPDPQPSPPDYGTRIAPANRTMGAGGAAEGAQVILWDVPPELDGYISVLEVPSAGAAEVRPLRDELCQRVASRRSGTETELELLFRPSPQGDKVVWLVLTDRPAAEALRASVGSAPPGCNLRGPQYPRDLLTGLQVRGVTVRAVGRAVLQPATEPGAPLP